MIKISKSEESLFASIFLNGKVWASYNLHWAKTYILVKFWKEVFSRLESSALLGEMDKLKYYFILGKGVHPAVQT